MEVGHSDTPYARLFRAMAAVRRVPVEHRFLGLDKRTFPFAIVALVVWALWVIVVPSVGRQVSWDDPVRRATCSGSPRTSR